MSNGYVIERTCLLAHIVNEAILMSTHNIQFHDQIRNSLNICFLELPEEFRRNSQTSSN